MNAGAKTNPVVFEIVNNRFPERIRRPLAEFFWATTFYLTFGAFEKEASKHSPRRGPVPSFGPAPGYSGPFA